MTHFKNLGSQISVKLPLDENDFIGRECPVVQCEGYFKLRPGTGLSGSDLPIYCTYCGFKDKSNDFFTKPQIEYAKSVALNQITSAVLKDFKSLEFTKKPNSNFGIGISLSVNGIPRPIHHYHEQRVETGVICDKCDLHYMIYGAFGFCPDCGIHNSLQIFMKSLELIDKILVVAEEKPQEPEVVRILIGNALEDCISAFDGFGRESCRIYSLRLFAASSIEIKFQNLERARERVNRIFDVDLATFLPEDEWELVARCFQKRHLLAHKMGVIDSDYLDATREPRHLLGRMVQIEVVEIRDLLASLRTLGANFIARLESRE